MLVVSRKEKTLRKVAIGTVLFDQAKQAAVVTLVEEAGDRILPIFIGLWEGMAIYRELNRAPAPRPMLHDIFFNVLHGLHTHLEKVVVDSLSDNTYYASLHFMHHDAPLIADARPSDAIALAVKFQAPIYVAEDILATAGKHVQETLTEEKSEATVREDVQAWLENIRPEDFADPQ
jgi:bifunctional DNase/RNase